MSEENIWLLGRLRCVLSIGSQKFSLAKIKRRGGAHEQLDDPLDATRYLKAILRRLSEARGVISLFYDPGTVQNTKQIVVGKRECNEEKKISCGLHKTVFLTIPSSAVSNLPNSYHLPHVYLGWGDMCSFLDTIELLIDMYLGKSSTHIDRRFASSPFWQTSNIWAQTNCLSFKNKTTIAKMELMARTMATQNVGK